jgi:hypothetical protein
MPEPLYTCPKCGGTTPITRGTEKERRNLIAQAKLGLEALIDEATGYQEVRDKDALRERYIELGGDPDEFRAPDSLPPDTRT